MDMSMYMEKINLVTSLKGTYKQADIEMVLTVVDEYKQKNNCSYKYAYEMIVEGNPSYSTYCSWRRKAASK